MRSVGDISSRAAYEHQALARQRGAQGTGTYIRYELNGTCTRARLRSTPCYYVDRVSQRNTRHADCKDLTVRRQVAEVHHGFVGDASGEGRVDLDAQHGPRLGGHDAWCSIMVHVEAWPLRSRHVAAMPLARRTATKHRAQKLHTAKALPLYSESTSMRVHCYLTHPACTCRPASARRTSQTSNRRC